jgi:hypothetical protein
MFSFLLAIKIPRQRGCVAGFEETLELVQTFRPRLPLAAKRHTEATTQGLLHIEMIDGKLPEKQMALAAGGRSDCDVESGGICLLRTTGSRGESDESA